MLIRYKKDFKKIAMGLLSFMPNEKNLQSLQTTFSQYESLENHHLFLWKEGKSIIGLIGVLVFEHQVQVQHISVTPSHRNQGFGKRMVESLKSHYLDLPLIANDETSDFIRKCTRKQDEDKSISIAVN